MNLFNLTQEITPTITLPNLNDYSANWNETLGGFNVNLTHGKIFYAENFFDKKISDRIVEYFLENDFVDWHTADWRKITKEKLEKITFKNIKWKQDSIKLYGKKIPLPRMTSWYGDTAKNYTYSGISCKPVKWNKGLLFIKKKIEKIAGVNFNSVLMNWYRDGEDCLNWHADDEPELGKNPVIASVNFGETRDFLLRTNDRLEKLTIPLKHGTFLLMSDELQHFWQHSIPKRKKAKGVRFNLTFRVIKDV